MGKLSDILTLAQQRARELNLPYEGALTPREAFELWQAAPGAKLVDCRTRAEWDWVGRKHGAIEIEWQSSTGNKDVHGQRNRVGGWRVAGLPWTQS